MEFTIWLPPPHALPSSAQKFSPPDKNFATQVQPPDPEINYTQADNFIYQQLIRYIEHSLYKFQNYASPNFSEAT